jgi:hypothetical protein
MQHMRERLRKAGVVDSLGLRDLQGGESIVVAGLVTIRQRPASANGTIFLLLEDEWGFINVIVPNFLVEPKQRGGKVRDVRRGTGKVREGREGDECGGAEVQGVGCKEVGASGEELSIIH